LGQSKRVGCCAGAKELRTKREANRRVNDRISEW
jgi:hypothetical protein